MSLAVARRLVAEDCRVLMVDLPGERLAIEAANLGPLAAAFPADLRDPDAPVNYTAAVEHFGSVDFLHNNAAIIGPMRPLTETTLHDFDEMMTANVRSVFPGLRAVIRQLLAQGKGGAIVNTASTGRAPA
jgi:NAD(P)-dependent dehydrogenase (short-subunit alcohol dehydrogenase family)